MALATKCLKKQKRVYFSYLWRGIALLGIGGYAGCMILQEGGIGKAPDNERSAGGILYSVLSKLMGQSAEAEKLVPICFAGFFFILAAIGIFNLIRGAWQIIPSHTMLGKSIMHQKKSHESFQDVIDSINTDLEQEPHVFDTVLVGREWIMENEVMRLSHIQGIFWVDAGKDDYILCCVDDAANIWGCGLEIKADRDRAMKYLTERLPEAVTGDREAYIAFLKGEKQTGEAVFETSGEPIVLYKNTKFCFTGADGIQVSAFTYEEAAEVFHALLPGQSMAVSLLTPAKYSEDILLLGLAFDRLSGRQWEVGLSYQEEEKEKHMVKEVEEKEAEDILTKLLKENQLPNLWKGRRE